MRDHPLERHYRDARQLMIVEGTSQIHRVIISRALLDRDLVYPRRLPARYEGASA